MLRKMISHAFQIFREISNVLNSIFQLLSSTGPRNFPNKCITSNQIRQLIPKIMKDPKNHKSMTSTTWRQETQADGFVSTDRASESADFSISSKKKRQLKGKAKLPSNSELENRMPIFKALPVEVIIYILEILYSEHENYATTFFKGDAPYKEPLRYRPPLLAIKNFSMASTVAYHIAKGYLYRFVRFEAQLPLKDLRRKVNLICEPMICGRVKHLEISKVCTEFQRHKRCRDCHHNSTHHLSLLCKLVRTCAQSITKMGVYINCNARQSSDVVCGMDMFFEMLNACELRSLWTLAKFDIYQRFDRRVGAEIYWREECQDLWNRFALNASTFWNNLSRLEIPEESVNSCVLVGWLGSKQVAHKYRFHPAEVKGTGRLLIPAVVMESGSE